MSELINTHDNRATIRWKLLTGASALALTAYVSSGNFARAEDTSHPLVWFELDGQFDSLTAPADVWHPTNLRPVLDHPVTGILSQTPRIGYDMGGSITFQPEGSDWSISAAIKYGKAKHGPRFAHDQSYKTYPRSGGAYHALTTYAFTSLHSVEETKHLILDFQAGKDVGLGLFGGHASSTVKIGARYAQFRERADGLMSAATNIPHKYRGLYGGYFFNDEMHAERSFTGIGPSIAWNGSAPIAGSLDDGLAIDWGIDAAMLFGRQKTKVQTHSKIDQFSGYRIVPTPSGALNYTPIVIHKSDTPHTYIRDKRVTVPNLGAFAGFSYRLGGEAKISLGYKADFFFGAIDGGIATAKKESRGFYGPFASITIGVGD